MSSSSPQTTPCPKCSAKVAVTEADVRRGFVKCQSCKTKIELMSKLV